MTNAVSFLAKPRQTRPWSTQEEAVRDILCQISDVDSVDVSQDTTIFQLGLDSINAVQISAKLRGLGYKMSSGEILEVRT
jgi:aryl carrier-like protein